MDKQDERVKSPFFRFHVIPVKAGIPSIHQVMDGGSVAPNWIWDGYNAERIFYGYIKQNKTFLAKHYHIEVFLHG